MAILISQQSDGVCQRPQEFHLHMVLMRPYPLRAVFSYTQAVAVREYHYQTAQVMAKRSDNPSFMDAGIISLAWQGKGHGVPVHMAHWLSNVSDCFIYLSKNS